MSIGAVPWWKRLFVGAYQRFRPRTSSDINREVDFVLRHLRIFPGGRFLDVGCGSGEHAIQIAARGYDVTGIDIAPQLIWRAQKKGRGRRIRFRVCDMRRLDYFEKFDAVTSIFTSFGYFDDRENQVVLQGMRRALRKGGRLYLDIVNGDWLKTHLRKIVRMKRGNLILQRSERWDEENNRVLGKWIFKRKGRLEKRVEVALRAYRRPEIDRLLHENHFRIEAVFGDVDGTPFSLTSRRIIVVATAI
ncbi:MAG: class I SAM-dependent methyltransferase [Deltaproteobacteria bacterium]|nr:class I SAM-dependent methyltransferase [Deltaproteobacteria bacterium]